MGDHASTGRKGLILLRRRGWALYAVLVAASAIAGLTTGRQPRPAPDGRAIELPAMTSAGPLAGRTSRIAYRIWEPGGPDARTPVVCIHGSPGGLADFVHIAPLLAAEGRMVVAPDLPGMQRSAGDAPSRSILAHARSVLALIEALDIPRAHVVGFSLGGGVALHMADLSPARIASITMMSSIGDQRNEGSGSHWFEHAKYAIGYGVAWAVRWLTPHFGLLDGTIVVQRSMLNFWDSDLRPLSTIMERLKTPTLILHGRGDFLVPSWAAERHHDLIPTSRLVMLDASHFLPFLQAKEASLHLAPFFARHDQPDVPPLRQSADLSPQERLFGLAEARFAEFWRAVPWWASFVGLAFFAAWRERIGASIAGLLAWAGHVDFGVAIGGLLAASILTAARAWRRLPSDDADLVVGTGLAAYPVSHWRERLQRRPLATVLDARFAPNVWSSVWQAADPGRLSIILGATGLVASFAWAAWSVLGTAIAGFLVATPLGRWGGPLAFLVGVMVAAAVPLLGALMLTRTGRRLTCMRLGRARRREYWPALLFYAPVLPKVALLALRHGGPMTFTAVNPGIAKGGGIIGESKTEILDGLAGAAEWVLTAVRIDAGPPPEERARQALAAIAERAELGGFPVILKPDSGQRGFGVRLARNERDVRRYFQSVRSVAMVQRYHPGPHECGVLWVRRPEDRGFIFSITRKEFPVVVGDGRRTIERLVWDHPRYWRQAGVFLERLAHRRREVPSEGVVIRLAESGNHCQGTLFADGAELLTTALEARMDAIAQSFRGVGGAGLDIGRFDLRYESPEQLRRGKGFAIIELNGTTGESGNVYDPDRSAWWAWRVLARHWEVLYELGAWRRSRGARPMTLRELLREIRTHARTRSGPALAD